MTRIKLILLIFGEDFDTNAITNVLKLSPTNFWKKGDKILGRNKELIRQESCWELDFDFVSSVFLDDITDQIVRKFSNNLDNIEEYFYQNKLQAKFNIIVEIVNNEKPALYFNKKFLNIVSKINGEIDIDLYNID